MVTNRERGGPYVSVLVCVGLGFHPSPDSFLLSLFYVAVEAVVEVLGSLTEVKIVIPHWKILCYK